MNITNKVLDDLWFSDLSKNKVFPIIYAAGTRGHSFCRIMQAHQNTNSLDYVEDICEYRDFEVNESFNRKLTHASFHDSKNKDITLVDSSIKLYIEKKLYKTNLLFHLAPIGSWRADTIHNTIMNKLYYSDKEYIYLYGKVDRPYFNKRTYLTIKQPNAYNVNIDLLYSKDYYAFEDEYFKLIGHFGLESRLNAVRAYILLNLERQKLMKPYDIGDRQFADKKSYNSNPSINNLFFLYTNE